MDSSHETASWVSNVIDTWKGQNIKLGHAATLSAIINTEKQLNISFPDTFKELYKKVDGFNEMDWNEHMFSVWSLDRIIEEYNYYRHPYFIGFCDFLINSHWIGFVRDQAGIYKRYDLAGHSHPEKIADNFKEAIELINANADILY